MDSKEEFEFIAKFPRSFLLKVPFYCGKRWKKVKRYCGKWLKKEKKQGNEKKDWKTWKRQTKFIVKYRINVN